MSLVMIDSGGSATVVDTAETQPFQVQLDRQIHRGAYATDWFISGSGDARPSTFRVTVEVAAASVDSVLAAARSAVKVKTPLWWADIHGITRAQARHLEGNWYRLRLEWIGSGEVIAPSAELGLMTEDETLLTAEDETPLETERGYA